MYKRQLTRTLAIIPITLVLAIVMARKENAAGAGAAVAGPGTDGLAAAMQHLLNLW